MKKGHFRLTCVAQKRCCLSSLLLWLVTLWPQCLSSLQNWSPVRAVQELYSRKVASSSLAIVFQLVAWKVSQGDWAEKDRQFEPYYSIPACGSKSITRRKRKKDRQLEPYYSIPACGSKSITRRKRKKGRQFEPYYSISACGLKKPKKIASSSRTIVFQLVARKVSQWESRKRSPNRAVQY